jgi:hypothetical protein
MFEIYGVVLGSAGLRIKVVMLVNGCNSHFLQTAPEVSAFVRNKSVHIEFMNAVVT